MSVNAETPIASSTANGVTTSFPYAFTVLSAADLVVQGVLSGITTVYTYGVHYTLTGLGTDAGSVEFLSPPANGTVITRYRSSELKRTTDYQDNGDLLAETLNRDLDGLWLALQELASGASGAPGSAEQLAALLAASTGSSRIGHILNAAGAVERTVQSKLRDTVSVLDFGAVGDGIADDSTALQAALNCGKPLDFGSGTYKHTGLALTATGPVYWAGRGARLNYVGTAGNIGVGIQTAPATTIESLHIEGITFAGGVPQLYIWPGTRDQVDANVGRINHAVVRRCRFLSTSHTGYNANFTLAFCADALVEECFSELATDNGIYVPYSENVRITNNVVRNCGGIGIAAGYHSIFANFGGRNVTISGNIVFNDESADTALNYISGIDVVFCQTYVIKNNVVANLMPRDSRSVNNCIRTAYVTEEYTLYDGDISGNIAYRPLNRFVTVGEIGNAEIRRLTICGNKFYDCLLSGIEIHQGSEAIEIAYNSIHTTGQHGIFINNACMADVKIHHNAFTHPTIQDQYNHYSAIYFGGLTGTVEHNTIDTGHIFIKVLSTASDPGIWLSGAGGSQTIRLRTGVTGTGTTVDQASLAGMTFGSLAEWIRLHANWDASIYSQAAVGTYNPATTYKVHETVRYGAGVGKVYRNLQGSTGKTPVPLYNATTTYALGDKVYWAQEIFTSAVAGNVGQNPYDATKWTRGGDAVYWIPMEVDGVANLPCVPYLRSTGERSNSMVRDYSIDTTYGLKLTSAECYLAIYAVFQSGGRVKVRNNTLNSEAWEYRRQKVIFPTYPEQPFYVGKPFLWERGLTEADTPESGARRMWELSESNGYFGPASLPADNWYLIGDRCGSEEFVDAQGPRNWVCYSPGFGSTSKWSPLYTAFDGPTSAIGGNGYAYVDVTVNGADPAQENHVIINLRNSTGLASLMTYGFVIAANTVRVIYFNAYGADVTPTAHRVHVYVYVGPRAAPLV